MFYTPHIQIFVLMLQNKQLFSNCFYITKLDKYKTCNENFLFFTFVDTDSYLARQISCA